jgi:hypothetical protein
MPPQQPAEKASLKDQGRTVLSLVQPSPALLQKRMQAHVQEDTSLFDGQGRKQFPNGDFYEGHFRKGKMEGKGIFVNARGDVYEGNFKNGFKHGKGRLTYKSGGYFEGDFSYNKMEGKG